MSNDSAELNENRFSGTKTIRMRAMPVHQTALKNSHPSWSRMQRGLVEFTPSEMALNSKIDGFIRVLTDATHTKHITVGNEIPEGLKIYADERMLEPTIRNLVANAIKFTPKGGRVTISASPAHDQSVVISVNDTGIGMSQTIMDNLFRTGEKVSRLGTEDEPSSGLGLLLCKDFVEKHGGRIWAESEEGRGSTFFFTLPGKL
ncbi:MAG: HAMP domain-containing sensor histidine kinase [Bacteroidota bacterium]